MPDQSHVGRRYGPSQRVIDHDSVGRFARALGGEPGESVEVPPTFAAVYCLFPILSELFDDADVGITLDGLIHTSQSFEWPVPVRAGDRVQATGEIASLQTRRGMVFLGLEVRAVNQDGATVCAGSSMLVARAAG